MTKMELFINPGAEPASVKQGASLTGKRKHPRRAKVRDLQKSSHTACGLALSASFPLAVQAFLICMFLDTERNITACNRYSFVCQQRAQWVVSNDGIVQFVT